MTNWSFIKLWLVVQMVAICLNYRSLPDLFTSLNILFRIVFFFVCVCVCVCIEVFFFPQAVISLVDQTGREKVRLHVDDKFSD